MLMVMNQMTTEGLSSWPGMCPLMDFSEPSCKVETMILSILQMRELRLSPWLSGGSAAGSPHR